jgi:hypothetical protein
MKVNVEKKGDRLHVLVTFKEIMYKAGRNRIVWRTSNVLQHLKANYPQYTIGSTIKAAYGSNFEPEKRRVEWIFSLVPDTPKIITPPRKAPIPETAPAPLPKRPPGQRPDRPSRPVKKIRRRIPDHGKTSKGNE